LPESCNTSRRCNKPDVQNQKPAKLPSFVQELQAECNQEFLETLEAVELEDWNRFGKVGKSGRSTSETPMMCSSMLKSGERNWPNSVTKRADKKSKSVSDRPAEKAVFISGIDNGGEGGIRTTLIFANL
jgi:hypothetical protein